MMKNILECSRLKANTVYSIRKLEHLSMLTYIDLNFVSYCYCLLNFSCSKVFNRDITISFREVQLYIFNKICLDYLKIMI